MSVVCNVPRVEGGSGKTDFDEKPNDRSWMIRSARYAVLGNSINI